MPYVGFDPKMPVFEQAKTVHALDGAAIVIDLGEAQITEFPNVSVELITALFITAISKADDVK
jgi:hypothetical protein